MAIRQYHLKSGEPRYQAVLWSHHRVIKTKTFRRKLDAHEWQKREELKIIDKTVGRSKGQSMSLEDFFQTIYWPRKTIRVATSVDYEGIYRNYIRDSFGNRKIAEIDDEEWSLAFHRLVRAGLSHARVNRIRTMISSVYAMAVKLKYVQQNPIRNIDYFEENLDNFDYWNDEEVSSFLKWAKQNENPRFSIYHLAYETGMRRGEVQALSRDCIDFNSNTIKIRQSYCGHTKRIELQTKGGRSRVVGMSEGLRKTLQAQLSSHNFDLLFCRKDGKPLSNDYFRFHFKKDQQKANARGITFHDLRHTFASHFVMKGGSLYDLQQLLGHEDIKTTQRYAHLAQDYLKSKASIVTFCA